MRVVSWKLLRGIPKLVPHQLSLGSRLIDAGLAWGCHWLGDTLRCHQLDVTEYQAADC